MDVLSKTKNRKIGHHFKKKFLVATASLLALSAIGSSTDVIVNATSKSASKSKSTEVHTKKFGPKVTVLRGNTYIVDTSKKSNLPITGFLVEKDPKHYNRDGKGNLVIPYGGRSGSMNNHSSATANYENSGGVWYNNYPGKKKDAADQDGAKSLLYFKRKDRSDMGHVGVLYKKVWRYYPITASKKDKPCDVSVKLIWLGGTRDIDPSWPNSPGFMTFHQTDVGVNTANDGQDKFRIELYRDEKGKMTRLHHKVPMSFWDIDNRQALFPTNSSKNFVISTAALTWNGTREPHLLAGDWRRPKYSLYFNKKEGKEKVNWNKKNKNPAPGSKTDRNTVTDNMPIGALSTFTSGWYEDVIYSHSDNSVPLNYYSGRLSRSLTWHGGGYWKINNSPSLGRQVSLSTIRKHNYYMVNPGNLFSVSPAKTLVSWKGKFQKDASLKKSDGYKTKKFVDPNGGKYYYRLSMQANWPIYADSKDVLHKFTIDDAKIPAGLNVGTPEVHALDSFDDKITKKNELSDLSKIAAKGLKPNREGGYTFSAQFASAIKKLDKEAIKGKKPFKAFGKVISVIIPVKPDLDALKFSKTDASGRKYAQVANVGTFISPGGQGDSTVITKIYKNDVQDPDPVIKPGKGVKFVYRMKPGELINTSKGSLSDDKLWKYKNYNKGVVNPGQWITYRLGFSIPDLNAKKQGNHYHQRFKSMVVSDSLDKRLDPKSVRYIRIGTKKGEGKWLSPKDDSNIKLGSENIQITLKSKDKKMGKDLLEKFVKMGKNAQLWIDYRVQITKAKGPTAPGVKEKFYNTAQLDKIQTESLHDKKHTTEAKSTTVYDRDSNGKTIGSHTEWDYKVDGKSASKSDYDLYTEHPWEKRTWAKYDAHEYDDDDDKMNFYHTSKLPNVIKTNRVENVIVGIPSVIPEPSKDMTWRKKDGTETTAFKGLDHDTEYTYYITQSLGDGNDDYGQADSSPGTMRFFQSIKIHDHIDPVFKVLSAKAELLNEDQDPHKASGKTLKSPQISGQNVDWVADKGFLQDKHNFVNNQKVVVKIRVRYTQRAKVTTTYINNKAKTSIDIPGYGKDLQSKTVKTNVNTQGANLSKTITKITDDWTGKGSKLGKDEASDPNNALNPKDPYTIHYKIHVTTGNNFDLNKFVIRDNLPENTTLVKSSVKVSSNARGAYDDAGSDISSGFSNQSTNTKLRLVANDPKKFFYADVYVNFDVKVKPEADWSDYYNGKEGATMHYDSTKSHTVNKNSWMNIPNIAYADLGHKVHGNDDDEDSQNDGFVSGSADFNMRVQMFDIKQVIVQDDDKWSKNLDPSHYLPRNRKDRTAVTTALKITMPNYMKLDSIKFMNEAKTRGFDKVATDIFRANLKLSHDDSLLINPDLGDSSASSKEPYNGKWPSELQKASGKTYYRFTKWAPKTKYYRDYAKLGDMRTGFKGSVNLKAHAVAARLDGDGSDAAINPEVMDNNYDANEVGIHLSNIYRYETMIDKATYSDDGKKFDYRVYGEVKGLAVDKNNKTNFDNKNEGQPITAWLKTAKGVNPQYSAGDKVLHLANGLGTGDVSKVYQDWNNVDATKITGVNSDHGYKSNSTLTEKKGHSVMLTNEHTDHDQTLVPDRNVDDVNYEKYKNQTITNANKTYTNPREFRVYFDYNKDFDGKDVTRVFREAYEMFARDKIDAKAGYGVTDTHKLETFTYYHDLTQKQMHDNYKTTLTSPDKVKNSDGKELTGIFDEGWTKNANAEKLDMTSIIVPQSKKEDIDKALQKGRNNNVGVDDLIDTRTANLPLVKARENWAKGEFDDKGKENKAIKGYNVSYQASAPNYRLSVMNYRFNKRLLKDGKQAFDPKANAFKNDNKNVASVDLNQATNGLYKNYLRNWLQNGQYRLAFTSDNPFGVGNAISINYTQRLNVYGHRYMSKSNGSDSSDQDEINTQPTISGSNAKGLHKGSDADWFSNNSADQAEVQ